MQEEVNEKTVALATKTGKMTVSVLQHLMRQYLSAQKQRRMQKQSSQQKSSPYLGKTTLKKLREQGDQLATLEITEKNIKAFERTAMKYGVTFALKKDPTQEPPKYVVLFRGKDQSVIEQAFQEFSRVVRAKGDKPSIRARIAKSRQKAQEAQHQHQKEKVKARETEPGR